MHFRLWIGIKKLIVLAETAKQVGAQSDHFTVSLSVKAILVLVM